MILHTEIKNTSRLYMISVIDNLLPLCHKISHILILSSLFFKTNQSHASVNCPGPKLHSLLPVKAKKKKHKTMLPVNKVLEE